MKLLEGYTKNSKIYEDHLRLLRKDGYQLKCSDAIFSNEEIDLIHNFGYWMEAISKHKIQPITQEQTHFQEMCDNNSLPVTPQERAWFKVHGRRKLEAELGDKLNVQYMPEEDEFYSREGVKKLRGSMYGVMNQTHNKM